MMESRREDAVSPVIGIMLMLVVTIIIAAVITGFATDMTADTEGTPMAVFDVAYVNMALDEIVIDGTAYPSAGYGDAVGNVGFRHKGGDAIPLESIEITIEQIGGGNDGMIISYRASTEETFRDLANPATYIEFSGSAHAEKNTLCMVVLGQEEKKTDAVITTGDIIHFVPYNFGGGNSMDAISTITPGTTVKWTISHVKSKGVIAQGEFIAENM